MLSLRRILANAKFIARLTRGVSTPAGESVILNHKESFLNIKLPDLAQPVPIPSVQIPYLPDFWESSTVKMGPEEQPLPKLLVVGDASALHGGGSMHTILPEERIWSEPVSENKTPEPPLPGQEGVFSDIVSDLGLASWGEMKENWRKRLS